MSAKITSFWFSHWRVPREATPIRGRVGISLQIVTIVVIFIYSCYLQLFLYLFIFIDEINLFDYCYTSKLSIYCTYSVFILMYCKSVHVL